MYIQGLHFLQRREDVGRQSGYLVLAQYPEVGAGVTMFSFGKNIHT